MWVVGGVRMRREEMWKENPYAYKTVLWQIIPIKKASDVNNTTNHRYHCTDWKLYTLHSKPQWENNTGNQARVFPSVTCLFTDSFSKYLLAIPIFQRQNTQVHVRTHTSLINIHQSHKLKITLLAEVKRNYLIITVKGILSIKMQ